jgi:hypothetical protein
MTAQPESKADGDVDEYEHHLCRRKWTSVSTTFLEIAVTLNGGRTKYNMPNHPCERKT